MKGSLIIISSPSGGGKGTVIKEVLSALPEVTFSVSYTTRPIRAGEKHGREYFFVSADEFRRLQDEGEFLEYAEVHGNLYGTSKSQIDRIVATGRDVILEIDVQGANLILDRVPDIVSIFILPPSFPVLAARLKRRATESEAQLNLRLHNAFAEVKEYEKFKYVVVNELLTLAVEDVKTIIRAERLGTGRRMGIIQGILDSFDSAQGEFTGE